MSEAVRRSIQLAYIITFRLLSNGQPYQNSPYTVSHHTRCIVRRTAHTIEVVRLTCVKDQQFYGI